ncbi:MAG: Gfo/Idh/MocA family oxidoreductase [Pseudomonadota bacterium]
MPDTLPRSSVRHGFIGCGMMGQEHLRNLALIDGARTTAIFEPDDGMATAALALAPGAARVPSLDALLARPDIDALVITSPNHCHADQLQQIARARPLPVLCEKPVCTSLAQVAQLRALAATHMAPLWVAMEYRYMPPIAALVAAAHAGTDTGGNTLLSIREHRYPFLSKVGDWNRFAANTGGTLVEKCCHFFDLMRLLMQADPIRLYASGAMNHNHVDERYGGRQPDILDNALVVLDFPGRRRALLELCMFAEGSRYQEEISVVGPRGKIECKVPGPGRFWPTATLGPAPVAQLIVSPRRPQGPRELQIPVPADLLAAGDHNGSTYFQHRRFFDLVRGVVDQPVEVTLEDGLKAVLIGLAAEESARSGVAVDLGAGPYRL